MTDMIERVDKALQAVPMAGSLGEFRRALAKAAIKAMREPTTAMTDAGSDRYDLLSQARGACAGGGLLTSKGDDIYEVMLDTALKEGE